MSTTKFHTHTKPALPTLAYIVLKHRVLSEIHYNSVVKV
jgi:hypothetical protein